MAANIKAWIKAFRPHTLPLAVSCVGIGNMLAYQNQNFRISTLILSVLTATLLQILSNLANDYGDTKHGADSENRIGPQRAVQSGLISKSTMKKAIVLFIILSLLSGVLLIVLSIDVVGITPAIVLLLIGVGAIWSAYAYTASDNPYGYKGYGDIFVFIFFGLISVFGSFYLQSGLFEISILLPAISYGLLSSAVLNLNNVRDFESDKEAEKITMAIRFGKKGARIYHFFLINTSAVFLVIFSFGWFSQTLQYLFFLPILLLFVHYISFLRARSAKGYYPLLKQLSFFVLIITASLVLAMVLF